MIIYKTTNLINNRIYIGKDKYNNPKYLGSGKLLKQAIKKYGKENFKKEILDYCSDEEHLNEREKFWIAHLNCQISDQYYNIGEGGEGGDNLTYNPDREAICKKMSTLMTGEANGMFGKTHSDETKKIISDNRKGITSGSKNPMFGKTHSNEVKLKIAKIKSRKLIHVPSKNIYDSIKIAAKCSNVTENTIRYKIELGEYIDYIDDFTDSLQHIYLNILNDNISNKQIELAQTRKNAYQKRSPEKRKHTSETKQKISESHKGKNSGYDSTMSKPTIHAETGMKFKSRQEVMDYFKISKYMFKQQLLRGTFING